MSEDARGDTYQKHVLTERECQLVPLSPSLLRLLPSLPHSCVCSPSFYLTHASARLLYPLLVSLTSLFIPASAPLSTRCHIHSTLISYPLPLP